MLLTASTRASTSRSSVSDDGLTDCLPIANKQQSKENQKQSSPHHHHHHHHPSLSLSHSPTACGVKPSNIFATYVPGAFELPVTARLLAMSKRVDVIVCLGCLIKGDTMHFEYIAQVG